MLNLYAVMRLVASVTPSIINFCLSMWSVLYSLQLPCWSSATDIDYMDGKHNGYVDAYNTALLFAKLQQTPDFVVNSFYSNLGIEREPLCSTLGDLFARKCSNCHIRDWSYRNSFAALTELVFILQ